MPDEFKFKCVMIGNNIHFTGDITDESANELVLHIRELEAIKESQTNKHIFINLKTYGGWVCEALRLYDIMKSSSLDITVICEGAIASAGTIIMLGGNKVVSYKHTSFMVHELTGGNHQKYSDSKIYLKHLDLLMEQMVEIYNKKLKKKIKKTDLEKDNWYSANQALDLGLIDEII